jgi:hypothetical protein
MLQTKTMAPAGTNNAAFANGKTRSSTPQKSRLLLMERPAFQLRFNSL